LTIKTDCFISRHNIWPKWK